MKTLDEVITVLEECFLKNRKEWCIENCPYLQNNEQTCRKDVLVDALDYLKEYYYRDKKLRKVTNHVENVCMQYICMIEELNKNEPLTWNELRTMEGKPVWVEFFYEDGQHFDSNWFLVNFVSESFCDVIGKLGTSRLVKNDYWQAYRKERFNTEYEDIPMEYFENGGI